MFVFSHTLCYSFALSQELKVTHIVNACRGDNPFAAWISYCTCDLADTVTEDLTDALQRSRNFIDCALKLHPRWVVFVHCNMGVSRSGMSVSVCACICVCIRLSVWTCQCLSAFSILRRIAPLSCFRCVLCALSHTPSHPSPPLPSVLHPFLSHSGAGKSLLNAFSARVRNVTDIYVCVYVYIHIYISLSRTQWRW